MRAAILALGLAVAAGPALAGDDKSAPARDDSDKVICKKYTKPNSRFTQKVCMTKAEWEQRTDTAMEAWSAVQNRTQTYGGKGD